MYQVAYTILRDEQMAEDAVQEAFYKLIKSERSFENASSNECKRYMITVIKHSSISIYNKRKREQELMFLSDKDEAFDMEVDDESSENHNLQEMIEQLPNKYYDVLDCLIKRNLSVKETAKELSISEANVRKRFERAKTMLIHMKEDDDGYKEFGRV